MSVGEELHFRGPAERLGLVPDSYARVLGRKGVVYRPTGDSLPTSEIAAVWNAKNVSAALMEFLDAVRLRMA